MKKIILTNILLFSFRILSAQEAGSESNSTSGKGIGFGIRYGIASNTISSNNTGGVNVSALFTPINVGFIFEGNLSDNFAIQPEMQYVQKGFSASGFGASYDAKLTYFGLNILPKLKFGNENFEASFFGGPTVNVNLDAKVYANGQSATLPEAGGLDMGATLGLGLANKFKSGKFFFDFRYNIGLSDISTESPQSSTDKLNQLGINIGYIFKIK